MSTPAPTTKIVINPPNQRISFKLPITYSDGTTPLDPKSITGVKISAGKVSGTYTKNIEDTDFTVDSDGFCNYPLANLGMDLTTPTYAVLATDVAGPAGVFESVATEEIGFQNLAPNPPQAVSVN
jgi:hypothetical protein